MAIPAYATDLTDIYTDTDNFSAVGGGRVTASETDDYIQGSNCWSHDPFSSGIEGGMYDDNGAPTITADDAVFTWTKCDVAATLATHAAGGIQVIMGTATTAYDCFYVLGSDDYVYGGWKCIPVDPTSTPSTSVGTPGAYDWFGVRWNVPGAGASKGYPMKIDAIRYGRNIEITAGEVANPASWDATALHDSTTTRQWGLVQPTDSGAEIQGRVYWGTAGASVYSRESNRAITIIDTEWTTTDFTQILFAHASNDIVWDNIGVLALGTNNRGIINFTVNPSVNGVSWTNSVFEGIDTTTLLANCTFDGSKWLSTNEVTAGGASLLNCKILTPTVATDSHGLLWNTATDPDGELDGMEFSKGTNAHHAIEFDATNTPTSITLRNIDFTGFNAANGNNDSALYFPSTSKSYTVNLVGCTGDISYKVGTGGSVTLISNPVTLNVTIQNTAGTAIEGARVLVLAGATGAISYNDTVTITRVSTTASVAHTAHGFANGDEIQITGAIENEYNGIQTISNVTTDAYDFTVAGTPTTPATGTIKANFVIINDTSAVTTGLTTDTRTYSANQSITGRARKSSGSPYYKTGAIIGTINKDTGLDLTVTLLSDE